MAVAMLAFADLAVDLVVATVWEVPAAVLLAALF